MLYAANLYKAVPGLGLEIYKFIRKIFLKELKYILINLIQNCIIFTCSYLLL